MTLLGQPPSLTRSIVNPDRNRNNTAVLLLAAIIWPAVAALYAFFTLKKPASRVVLVYFLTLLGYRFIIADQRFDAYRLALLSNQFAQFNWSEFMSWVNQNCFSTEACIDPVQPFLTFFLTRISDHYSVAFAGYAAIFATFSIATLTLIRQDFYPRTATFSWFFLLLVMSADMIQNVGGFRFNTAVWVYLLGAYMVFARGRNAGFLFITLAAAFHYAFLVLIALSLLLRLVRLPLRIAIILALVSFIISPPIGWLANTINSDVSLGAAIRGARYLSAASLDARADTVNGATSSNLFFFVFQMAGIKFVLGLWMAYLLLLKRDFAPSDSAKRFLVFALLLFSATNLFSDFPSFGRYLNIAITLLYASFIPTAAEYSKRERWGLLLLLTPVVGFSLLFPVRIALGVLDFYAFMPTPFLLFVREAIL